MLEIIELRITSPRVELPGLESAIANLKTLDGLLDQISKHGPINLQGFAQANASIRGMSDTAKVLVDNLERAGQTSAAGALRTGFKSAAEEAERLNIMASNLQQLLRKAPAVGSPIYTGNPGVANQVDALQSALASVNLRRREIGGAQSDVAAQAQFDREAAALEAAEKKVTAAAGSATGALRAQGEVVSEKAGQMGQLAGAADSATVSERKLSGAAGESALLQQRFKTTAEGTERTLAQFRTGIGETQSVLGKSGDTVVDQINYLEKYRDALRANTAEYANRRIAVRRGSGEEVQLLRDEAAEIDRITQRFRQFQGTAEQQRAEVRQAALLRRAAEQEAKLGQAAVTEFQRRSTGFEKPADTRRTTLPTGEVQERRSLTRDVGEMRESIALTSRFDAQGKLLNATLEETNRHVDRLGQTTQSSLGGTIGMAAKFIAIYRGLDLIIRGVEDGAKATIEFERRVATLSIVFHGTAEEARQLAVAVLDQAAALGQSGVAALEVATDFARFGLRQADVLEATRVALIAANVAQLDLAQSGKYLQAIYSGYQLQVGQLIGVLGSLDTVSHSYNVTNQQLLEGLSRVAPLAKQAGLSLNELIGYEAVITGRTARPGQEAGTALKSLISRFAKAPTQQALQDVAGISTVNQAGELKSASQLINELYISYQNLGRAEQQELLVKIAGTQQASRIAALLDGYLKSQDLSIRASLDLTRAERENIAVRNTLSSQLGTLRGEWEKFWVASANPNLAGGVQSNITDIVKNLSNMLHVLSALENLASNLSQKGGPGSQGNAGFSIAQDFVDRLPFNIGGAARIGNRQFDAARNALKSMGLDDVFRTDAQRAAEALNELNAELDKMQKRGEAFESAGRQIQTVGKLIDTAPIEKRAELLRAASRAAAPTDVRRQEEIFAELNNLAKANNFIELHTRLTELDKEAQDERSKAIDRSNKILDYQISGTGRELQELEARRSAAARRNDKGAVEDIDRQIEQKQSELAGLERRRHGLFEKEFPEGEDAYSVDTATAKQKQLELLQARFEGIKNVVKAFPTTGPQEFFHVDEINRELDEIKKKSEEIDAERLAIQQQTATMSEAERHARLDALTEQKQSLDTDQQKLETLKAYAVLQDSIAHGRRQGRIEPEQFKIGRDETEQLIAEARGIMENLLPQAVKRAQASQAAGDTKAAAEAQAEALELTNQLSDAQLRLDERRYKIAADIANAREKEAEAASKNLITASREDQLRAALAQRFIEQRGGKGFSASEFAFLDPRTQQALERLLPGGLPEQLQSTSGLRRELARNRRRDDENFRAPEGPRTPRQRQNREPQEPRGIRDRPDRRRFPSDRAPREQRGRTRGGEHLESLQREQQILTQQFKGLNSAIDATRKFIESTIGRHLISTPPGGVPSAVNVPGGAFKTPDVNINVSEKFSELTSYLEDVVVSRFDRELAEIRSEFRGFVNGNRIAGAQAAATGAI